MSDYLKSPYPWFGGKSKVASLIWKHFWDVDNYVEPFFGSGAVLLARPTTPKIETVNDLDCYLSNFWRSIQRDPEATAAHADYPVSEIDLHARHRYLVLSEESVAFRERMLTDPDYFDARLAGWWCWGLCCWIGSGWCITESKKLPKLSSGDGVPSTPSPCEQLPKLQGYGSGCMPEDSGTHLSKQLPRMTNDVALLAGPHRKAHAGATSEAVPRLKAGGQGINVADLSQKIPNVNSRGVLGTPREGRPQLADAFDIGRGVNANGDAGTCDQRRTWLMNWFGKLSDRLRLVRVCCGDWSRVCSSDSVTTRLGITGVFLDPPYSAAAGRNSTLYSQESLSVAHEVRAWCLEWGRKKSLRICLAGYAGEGHEELEAYGWQVMKWKASGGYGNRTEKGRSNAAKECLWFSPHCNFEATLFDAESPCDPPS